ncbi:MAG: glycosyltransferase family 39 protein [Chloroflexota bacterium]
MSIHSQTLESSARAQSKVRPDSLDVQKLLIGASLALILLIGAFLRFYELGVASIGNTYYAATVQSMLASWHNFFFAAFEPGGSVTVDKPPLGFWIQAGSAYLLGVNGFALALPQALAGVCSIPLLYALVKRHFGAKAGLLAALVLAITPVTVSTERNNTIDGLLVFVLLLATWAFLKAVHDGRLRYLLLGVFLVGLGFNIKMLQAYLPLPALYAVYFLGARHNWWKRLWHLALATVVLLVVSFSWAVIVDLTPADQRPFIGSSTDNSVIELITGHNGLSRLVGGARLAVRNDGPARQGGSDGGQLRNAPLLPPGDAASGQRPSGAGQLAPGGQPAGDGGGRNQEVGEAGWLRLLSEPLVTEAGWLLPLAVLGIPLALVVTGLRWPLSNQQLGLALWAGWLLPEMLYFTFTTGLFHSYYLIMLGPPIAALVAVVAWALWRLAERWRWLAWALALLLSGFTLALQWLTLTNYLKYAWAAWLALPLWLAGLGLLAWKGRPWLGKAALALVCLSLVVAPLAWSGLTTLNANPNVNLPSSGPSDAVRMQAGANSITLNASQQMILAYLLENTNPDSYLVATLNARQAAPYILATSRPVLTFGGFMGSDNVVDVETLSQMVADGELRYVLAEPNLAKSKPEISTWVQHNCQPVSVPGLNTTMGMQPGPDGDPSSLYDCGV